MRPARKLFGLGANVSDPAAQLAAGVRQLAEILDAVSVSHVYRSAPVGYADQPDFLNLLCAGETQLVPDALLAKLQQIEQALGRIRSFRKGPRTIDIDLLAYGDLVFDTPKLTLPHPRMHQRAFVLVPLAEIAPD